MTLIILLIGLALETFYGVFAKYRRFTWFIHVFHWLETHLSRYRFWDGVPGVLLTLACPLLVLLVAGYGLGELLVPLGFIFTVVILVFSLGPDDLNAQLDNYLHALESGETEQARELAAVTMGPGDHDRGDLEPLLIGSILVQSHQRTFAVIFWFVVLGAFGALLVRLVTELKDEFAEIHGGYADAVRDLYQILGWPSARLLAIGFALSGSLVHAFDGWDGNDAISLEGNDSIIRKSGLGAIQYGTPSAGDENEGDPGYWIREVQGLINRTLIVWLTVLGVTTLAGWLA